MGSPASLGAEEFVLTISAFGLFRGIVLIATS